MKQGSNQKIKFGYDRCYLNIASNVAVVMCDGRLFQRLAPETGNACLPMVERLNGSTTSWLEKADWSLCWDGTPVTRVKYDDRYAGALPFKALLHSVPTEDDESSWQTTQPTHCSNNQVG